MSQRDKLLLRLADKTYDATHRFKEVKALLLHLGYKKRSEGGSHICFGLKGSGMRRSLTLTEVNKGLIPRYQAKQVRDELKLRGFI